MGGEIGCREVNEECWGEASAILEPSVIDIEDDSAAVALLSVQDVQDDGGGDIAHCWLAVCDTGFAAAQVLYTVGEREVSLDICFNTQRKTP